MNLYRITRIDGEWAYRGVDRLPEVKFGDRQLATTIVRQAKAENGKRRATSRAQDMPYCPVRVQVERHSPAFAWVDVTPEFWDPEEGGTREPRGDSPDPKAPGEARVPAATGQYQASENRSDDSAGIEHAVPLTKNSEICPNGILAYDMVIPPYRPPVEYRPLRDVLARSRARRRENE